MARKTQIYVRVRFAWWWVLYVEGVNLMSFLTGMEPDMDKVCRVAKHAVHTKVWVA